MHLTDFVVACVLSAAKEILSVSSVAKKVQEWAFYAEEELGNICSLNRKEVV